MVPSGFAPIKPFFDMLPEPETPPKPPVEPKDLAKVLPGSDATGATSIANEVIEQSYRSMKP
jgi:hypothetical protein